MADQIAASIVGYMKKKRRTNASVKLFHDYGWHTVAVNLQGTYIASIAWGGGEPDGEELYNRVIYELGIRGFESYLDKERCLKVVDKSLFLPV